MGGSRPLSLFFSLSLSHSVIEYKFVSVRFLGSLTVPIPGYQHASGNICL